METTQGGWVGKRVIGPCLYQCTYVTYRLILVNSTEGGGRLEILVKSLPEICSWKILWSPALVRNRVCFQMFRIWKDEQHYTKYLIKIQNGKTQKIEKMLKAFNETKIYR